MRATRSHDRINYEEDEDLNEIMARSEEELALFHRMDKDRQATDPYGPGKKFPRLMCEDELPDIYLQEDEPEGHDHKDHVRL